MNKIQFKKAEHLELIKAMASKNKVERDNAQSVFAALVGPVASQVLKLRGTASMIYEDWPYDQDTSPEIQLDLFYDKSVNHITIWSQSIAGGLGTNLITGLTTLRVATYNLDTAISFLERNVARGELQYVSLATDRAFQELLIKTELNAWMIIMKVAAEASTNGLSNVITSNTPSVLQADDFNRLITRNDRLNQAFNGGTPVQRYSTGPTDIFLSPELMQEIRGFAYQPMNTRGVPNSDESTAVPLPDKVREEIWRSAGVQTMYDINLHKMLEMGTGQPYNALFKQFYTGSFTAATDEVAIALDLSRKTFLRPIETNSENGSELVFEVDDQFQRRAKKFGFFGSMTEGRICLDSRTISAIIV